MADGKQPGFVGRLGQIAFGGFKDSMSSYFNDVSSLKSDAETIKTQLIQDGKSAADVFNRMKKGMGSPAKKIHDWFYTNEASMFGFSDGEDDFDAGFKPDAAGDETAEPEVRNLNAEDMTDIAKKQTAEQYKIASKQADLNIANTAEIVSAINSRSAEMTASINKVNESLITISKKLDGIMGGIDEASKEQKKQASIFNSDGSLSLAGMFNAGHETLKEKTEMLGMVKTFAQFFTPEGLASMGFSKLFEKEFSFLGGKSVEDLSRRLNDAITDSVQTGLLTLIKNDKFQTIFEGMGDRSKNKDFQSLVTNNYNTKPAVFDGMTRQSIIHIIPEYLKNIEAAITNSAPKTINEKGQLTTKTENYFQNNIRNSMFGSQPMEYGTARTNMLNSVRSYDAEFSSKDLDLALKALKSGFLMILLNGIPFNSKNRENNSYRQNAQAILHPDEVGPNAPTTWEAREMAIKMLVQSSGKGAAYWENVFDHILGIFETNRSERQKFARKCTTEAEKVVKEAEKFAKTHTHAHQAGKITFDLVSGAFTDAYQRANYKDTKGTVSGAAPVTPVPKPDKDQQPTIDSASSNPKSQSSESNNAASIVPEIINGPSGIPSINSSLKGIYDILNRGIDVFVVNKKGVFGSQTTPFGKGGSSSSSNNKGKGGKKNKKERQSPAPEAQQDYVDSTASNSEEDNSMFQEPEDVDEDGNVREDPKKKSFIERVSEVLRTPLKGSAVIPGALRAKEAASEVASETYNNILDQVAPEGSRMRELYDQITESEGAQAVREKGKKISNTVSNKILGEETEEVDEETGAAKRKGGLFGWIGNKKEKVKEKAKDKVEKGKQKVKDKIEQEESKLSDTQILERTQTSLKRVQKMADTAAEKSEKPEEGASTAQQDQMIVQQVMAMIEVAMKDGEISASDIMTINNLINQVKDQKIKKQLKQAVVPMMKRNAASVSNVPTGSKSDPEKAMGFGSIFKTLVKYAGLIFRPITKILGSGLKVLGGIAGAVLKLSAKIIKSGVKDIYYGTKQLGQGLFGSKKEGEESVGLIRRILTMPNRLFKAFNAFTNNVFPKLFDKALTGFGKLANFVTDAAGAVFKGLARALKGFGEKFVNFFTKEDGLFAKIGKSKLAGSVGRLATSNDFMKGLTSGYREKKEATRKANDKRLMDAPAATKSEALLGNVNTVISEIKTSWDDNFKKDEEQTSEFRLNLFTKLDLFSDLLGNNNDEAAETETVESEDSSDKTDESGAKSEESSAKSENQDAENKDKSKKDKDKDKVPSLQEQADAQAADKAKASEKDKNKTKENNDGEGKKEKKPSKSEKEMEKLQAKRAKQLKKLISEEEKKLKLDEKRLKNAKNLDAAERKQLETSREISKARIAELKDKAKAARTAAGKPSLGDRIENAREAGAAKGSMGLDVGKTLGGIANILGGIAKVVLGAITALSGFKALMNLIQSTLTKSLTPLNKAFQKMIKVLKPVLNTVMKSIKAIASVVTDIVGAVLEAIKPILTDIVGPLLEQLTPIIVGIAKLLESLAPIISLLVNVLIMPLVTSILTVVVPAITLISSVVQIIAGVIEMLLGAALSIGGLIIQTIGKLVPIGGNSIEKAGSSMKSSGVSLMESGKEMAGSGLRGIASIFTTAFDAVFGKDEDEEEKEEDKKEDKKKDQEYMKGSALEGLTGMGDTTIINNNYNTSKSEKFTTNSVTNSTNSSTGQIGDISNVYGAGESQKSYGGYLGMDKNGCGPTALADAIGRRTGRKLSAGSLAAAMSNTGSYDTSRGTSAAGFMRTSAALGSRVTPGGVTQRSLKRATPNNPVTLLGSGGSFGTRSGNNHYVNVIGSNGKGVSYVSNPISGRVERRSTSELVGNSVLGLYGSGEGGDGSSDLYTFPEAVSDAINELKSMASNLLKIFTGPTAEEQYQENLDKEKKRLALEDAKNHLGEDFDKFNEEAKQLATEDYMKKHPKLDSETDEEYQAKIDKYYEDNQQKYLAKTSVFETAKNKVGNFITNLLHANDESNKTVDSASSEISSASSFGGGNAGGAQKMLETARSYIGQKGTHFFEVWGKECDWCAMFVSTCGKESGNEDRFPWSSSCNEQIAWWKSHNRWLGKTNDLQPGDIIYFDWDEPTPWTDKDYPGKPVDHVGVVESVSDGKVNTIEGNSGGTGDYTTSYVKCNSYDLDYICIVGYARPDYVPAANSTTQQGKISMSSNLANMSAWNSYKNKEGVREFIQYGFDAGMSPAGVATIMSTGIFEDSGKKIFNASKSLTDVTYDYNGQQAVGIMNWADIDTAKYGSTVPEQLSYIQRAYFAQNPEHSRGKTVDPYRAEFNWGSPYEVLMGYKPSHSVGEPIGPIMDSNLLEGSSWFYGGALVPECFKTPSGFKYVATAADAYNWMIDEGIVQLTGPQTNTEKAEAYNNKVGSGIVHDDGSIYFSDPGTAANWEANRPKVGDKVVMTDNARYYTHDGTLGLFANASGMQNLTYKVKSINADGSTTIESYGGDHVFTYTLPSNFVNKRKETESGSASPAIDTIKAMQNQMSYYDDLRKAEEAKYGSNKSTWGIFEDYAKAYQANDEKAMAIKGTSIRGLKDVNGVYIDPSEIDWDSQYYKYLGTKGKGDGSDYDIETSIISGLNEDMQIPSLDDKMSYDKDFWSEMGLGSNAGTSVYNITKTDDKAADARVKSILDHTFEVKSASIEGILTKILDRMEEKRTENANASSMNLPSKQKLFEERIPSSISKLSIG